MKLSFITMMVLCLSGCGIQQLAEDTRDEVRTSNGTQRQILDNIKKTLDATDELTKSMKKTEEAIHLQILTVSMEQLLSPNNTISLAPPSRMMPYAEAFAKEATEDEIIKVSYVLLQDAKNAEVESRQPRMVSLTAMGAIAGLTSQEKVRNILDKQIAGRDRYEDAAYAFAMARYNFVRDFLFKPATEGSVSVNLGTLREASTHFRSLSFLASLPYAGRFGVEIPSLEVKEQLEISKLKILGKTSKRRFEKNLTEAELGSAQVKEYLSAFD